MKSKFCPFCGEKTVLKEIGDEGAVPYCASCGCALFDSPRPCVIVLAVNEKDEAVLIRQSYVSEKYPVCVAGYIKPRERAEETAARELLEETGLRAESLRYIGSYPHTAKELLMLGFAARVKKRRFFFQKRSMPQHGTRRRMRLQRLSRAARDNGLSGTVWNGTAQEIYTF